MSDRQTRLEWGAAERLHQAFLTGALLFLVQARGADAAADFIFRTFRRQHLDKFLPGLRTLGLDGLPHAVACAQFIYLANRVGGVKVEVMAESDRKAWVRYPPPRWIYEGPAICAIPRAVPIAFLRAFHAYCGVSLENRRLGFVCTGIPTDGDPGLEGYFREYERDLREDERLRFAPEERAPRFDASSAPSLPFDGERLLKARRNYAVQYLRVGLPVLCDLLGGDPEEVRRPAFLVGMQLYDDTVESLGGAKGSAEGFADLLAALLRGCGDSAQVQSSGGEARVRVPSLRVLGEDAAPVEFDAWNGLFEGALAAHDRDLVLSVESRVDRGDPEWSWSIRGTD